ncbi:hypothetical protein [Amycolatopsis minnesotensis]|uniref:Uncharacterized protein n=1 Tax=Amycolatopsis minnesotensis TaxID=337894 RepID=A0ABP5CE63_9PSEU
MTRQPPEGKRELAEMIALRARVNCRTGRTLPNGRKQPVPVTRLRLEETATEFANSPRYRDTELPALRTVIAACKRQAAVFPGWDILALEQSPLAPDGACRHRREPEPQRCRCGYAACCDRDMDEHTTALTNVNDGRQHARLRRLWKGTVVDPAEKLTQEISLTMPIAQVSKIVQRLEHAKRTGDLRGLAEFADELREAASALDELDELVFGKRDDTAPTPE